MNRQPPIMTDTPMHNNKAEPNNKTEHNKVMPVSLDKAFHYHTEFILDRQHYEECFDESVPKITGMRPYLKAAMFAITGIALLYTPVEPILGYLFMGLSAVEALSVKYKKPWWTWRQLMSKAANNPVGFTMDTQGIHLKSQFVAQSFLWQDLNKIEITEQGYLLQVDQYRGYISKRILDESAQVYLSQQITRINQSAVQ